MEFDDMKLFDEEDDDAATVVSDKEGDRAEAESPDGIDDVNSLQEMMAQTLIGNHWLTGAVIEAVGKRLVPPEAYFFGTGFLPDVVAPPILQAKPRWKEGFKHFVVPLEQAENSHWTGV
jgi:hypothetical protein